MSGSNFVEMKSKVIFCIKIINKIFDVIISYIYIYIYICMYETQIFIERIYSKLTIT